MTSMLATALVPPRSEPESAAARKKIDKAIDAPRN
jgi:hypothetical protein